jgi:hypothetical protein
MAELDALDLALVTALRENPRAGHGPPLPRVPLS